MDPQLYSWTCSVCTFTWIIQATGVNPDLTREEAGAIIGHPECVNATYGLMSAQCLIDALATFGLHAKQGWYTFAEAYSICREHTGAINPMGMYHFMAIRGVSGDSIWVANSAQGYQEVYDNIDAYQYNMWGPTQLIWIESKD